MKPKMLWICGEPYEVEEGHPLHGKSKIGSCEVCTKPIMHIATADEDSTKLCLVCGTVITTTLEKAGVAGICVVRPEDKAILDQMHGPGSGDELEALASKFFKEAGDEA